MFPKHWRTFIPNTLSTLKNKTWHPPTVCYQHNLVNVLKHLSEYMMKKITKP